MNEVLLAKFLQMKVNIVHTYDKNGNVLSYYCLNINDEFSEFDFMPSYCEAYLVLVDDKYKFYDKHRFSFEYISREFAHDIVVSQEYDDFINFEVWLNDRYNQTIFFKYNKAHESTKAMVEKLIKEFEDYESDTNKSCTIPKECFSKYNTLEFMQYKYVNDRDIKEWVGSATIIDNGIHSPKKTVKAGHIIDKNKVVHDLYMNDYILRTTEDNVFVIVSEDVFNRLFEVYDTDQQLIINEDSEE